MEILDKSELNSGGKPLETVLAEGYSFRLGDYITSGFRLFGNDAGNYIGFAIVYFIISIFLSFIPFINWLAQLLFTPALNAGWFFYGQRHKTGQEKSFSNFFDGFRGGQFIQLALCNLVTGIFTGLAVAVILVPAAIILGIDFISNLSSLSDMRDPEEMRSVMAAIFTGKLLLVVLLAVLIGSLIYVLYSLAPMFIVFRGMGFWDAMEASRRVVMKNYFQFLLFFIVLVFLQVIGVLFCGIGLLITIPVFYLALYSAFEDIMGTTETSNAFA